MQVQLYALFFGGIDDLHHFRAENGVRAHNVFAVVFIVLHGYVTSSAVPFLMSSIFSQSFAC